MFSQISSLWALYAGRWNLSTLLTLYSYNIPFNIVVQSASGSLPRRHFRKFSMMYSMSHVFWTAAPLALPVLLMDLDILLTNALASPRRWSAAALLLRSRVRIQLMVWMFVFGVCLFVWSVRGLCVGLISRSEKSYRVCVCVCVCDLETLTIMHPRPGLGCCATEKKSIWP